MADPSLFSSGKHLWKTATDEGAQIDDSDDVEAFMVDRNARTKAERLAVLGRGPAILPRPKTTGRVTAPGTRPRPKQPSGKRRKHKH